MFPFTWFIYYCLFQLGWSDEGLYKSSDDVVILNNDSFTSSVLQSDSAWIVEFYNSWCGHCIHFAPKWKEFATDIKGWERVISVGAVDCAKNYNVDLCRKYDVKGYPSLIFFPPFATAEYKGANIHDQDIDSIRLRVVDYVTDFTGDSKPTSWPILQPLVSLEKIWEEAKDTHKHVIVMFENEKSYVGREVILDLCQYKHLLIRTVTKRDIAKFGITRLPSLFLLHADGRFEHVAKRIDERAGIVKVIKDLIGASSSGSKGHDQDNEQIALSTKRARQITNGTVVFMQDLESALSYSFRQEIAIHKTIENGALEALKNFIKILTKYFPGEDYLMKFLLRVKTWIDTVTSGLTGEVWVYYIDSLQTVDTYLPDKISWVGCQGSEPKFRGYPCSMWTLFHTLTVNAYLVGKNRPKFLYGEVLNAVADYMKYFFGCQICTKHFLKMAEKRQISSAGDQVMWLWNAHNQANRRLQGDDSEDPWNPKIVFPSFTACPECRTGSEVEGDHPIWDENKVLNFLVKMYSKENILKTSFNITSENTFKKSRNDLDWWERMQRERDLKKITEIRKMKKQRLEEKLKESGQRLPRSSDSKTDTKINFEVKRRALYPSGFSKGDMSMCVLYYGLCLGIIALLYYYFVMKRKMNPCNNCTKSKSHI